MVERFSWLLISDIHLRSAQDPWAQSVVLRDLVRSVEHQFKDGNGPSFVVVSGDLAFSGLAEEYRLVTDFLDALGGVLKLPRRRFFPVSGNHDINRKTQTTCFAGARHVLKSPQKVEEFLGLDDERKTLFRRMNGYLEFDTAYCRDQPRQTTADGLGYVAELDLDGFPICVLGLHSSWMCGGDDDKGNLLIGDRPAIEALELLRQCSPRLVLGVMHHPNDWMQEFDQRSIELRLYPACDLIHRGHLHDPGSKLVSNIPGQVCIVVAAGAGYAGRLFTNSYSHITVDLSGGTVRIETFIYDPEGNDFKPRDDVSHPLKLRGNLPGTAADVSAEVAHVPDAARYADYIAALILGMVTEVPIKIGGQIIFAAPSLLNDSQDGALTSATHGMLGVANLLLAFRDTVPLNERFQHVRDRVGAFVAALKRITSGDANFAAELESRARACAALIARSVTPPFANTAELLQDLVDAGEWVQLEETARKHAGSSSRALSAMGRRFLVVALANQGDGVKATAACALLCEIVNSPGCEPTDFVQAAVLLYNQKRYNDACALLKEFTGRYRGQLDLIRGIGQKVVIETKDQELAKALGIGSRSGG